MDIKKHKFWRLKSILALNLYLSVCYVAVRTIVLSRHIVDFWGLAGWKLRLRPLRFFYVQL